MRKALLRNVQIQTNTPDQKTMPSKKEIIAPSADATTGLAYKSPLPDCYTLGAIDEAICQFRSPLDKLLARKKGLWLHVSLIGVLSQNQQTGAGVAFEITCGESRLSIRAGDREVQDALKRLAGNKVRTAGSLVFSAEHPTILRVSELGKSDEDGLEWNGAEWSPSTVEFPARRPIEITVITSRSDSSQVFDDFRRQLLREVHDQHDQYYRVTECRVGIQDSDQVAAAVRGATSDALARISHQGLATGTLCRDGTHFRRFGLVGGVGP